MVAVASLRLRLFPIVSLCVETGDCGGEVTLLRERVKECLGSTYLQDSSALDAVDEAAAVRRIREMSCCLARAKRLALFGEIKPL